MGDFKILFVGDVMPGGVLEYQKDYCSDALKKYLTGFDLRVATLEVAIGDNIPFDDEKMKGRQNIIYSKNNSMDRVVDLDINVVSLANNHIFDLGVEGFKNTIALLNKNRIQYCGAGANIEEASRPVIIEKNGKTLAFLTYCDYDFPTIGHIPIATASTYGVNPMVIENVVAEIKYYKSICDYVFVLPHWGMEYNRFPTCKMKNYSLKMIDAGADLIVGSHAHVAQPNIKYKSKRIYYGVGNFLFPDFYMKPPRPMWYPLDDYDLSTIKTTPNYPFPIKQPMKRVWGKASRVGLMVETVVSNKLYISERFSVLRSDNIADIYENKKLKCILSLMGLLVHTPFYRGGKYLRKPFSLLQSLRRRIKLLKIKSYD